MLRRSSPGRASTRTRPRVARRTRAAVRVGGDDAARPGRPTVPGCSPNRRRTGGPLALGRAVELPDDVEAEEFVGRRRIGSGQGAPAWATSRNDDGSQRRAGLVQPREQPLQVGRDAEHRRRAHSCDRGTNSLRLEPREHDDRPAGQQRPDREPQGSGVVDRATRRGRRRRREPPQLAFLAHERPASSGDSSPDQTPFGRPVVPDVKCIGRHRGQASRSASGPPSRAVSASPESMTRDGSTSRDDRVPLVGRQPRIERHRHDAGARRTEHDAHVVGRAGDGQHQAVALAQTPAARAPATRRCAASLASGAEDGQGHRFSWVRDASPQPAWIVDMGCEGFGSSGAKYASLGRWTSPNPARR